MLRRNPKGTFAGRCLALVVSAFLTALCLQSIEAATPTATPTPTSTPTPTPPPPPTFTNWENHPVHGVDLSPNGTRLAICNLPDDRIEIYDVSSGMPSPLGAVMVGLDPMSVRFRTDTEVWVANHVSDSISVVDLTTMSVVHTIQTLDEPADLIFAGSPTRVFVSCVQVNTLQVFNPITRLETNRITIDAEAPRALATNPAGTEVYAAIFESGNASTILMGGLTNSSVQIPNVVNNLGGPYGGVNPPPNSGAVFNPPINPVLPTPPRVGLIVKKNSGGQWRDDNTGDWTAFVSGANANNSGRPVGWDLPDRDVAILNTTSLAVTYGTGLMNICMAIGFNPGTGEVTVVGTDGTNEIRFEPVLSGKFTRVKMGIVNPSTLAKSVVDLNADHLNYSVSTLPLQSDRDKSIGDPRGIVWNSAGTRGYVTGMGSNNILIIDPTGAPIGAKRIYLGPGPSETDAVLEGPTALVLDEPRNRLYILDRFSGSIAVVDTTTEAKIGQVSYFDPTPSSIKIGRNHFYNTHKNSGLGQIACASCHIDGRMDRLAWDLGDPTGTLKNLAGLNLGDNVPGLNATANPPFSQFHPMKGPMTTQTFQNIIGLEPFHWRGDRLGLEEFNPAFMGLQGDDTMLSPTEMQEYEDFVAKITVPPNPNRNFDNSLPTSLPLPGHFSIGRFSPAGTAMPPGNAVNGRNIYIGVTPFVGSTRTLDGPLTCVICHSLPTGAGGDVAFNGLVYNPIAPGPLGQHHIMMVSVDGSTQTSIKVPQLRNQFRKTGCDFTQVSNRAGFGLLHDGSVDSLVRFLSANVFSPQNDQEVSNLVAFVLSLSGSDLPQPPAPDNILFPPGPPGDDTHAAVGKQLTITNASAISIFGTPTDDITEMIGFAAAEPGRCDLVVRGAKDGVNRGWYYDRVAALFRSDRDGETIAPATLRALASVSNPLTYTVVPRGSGRRIGTDRDGDGFGDRTELDFGTNPADPLSFPAMKEINVVGGPLDFGNLMVTRGPSLSQPVAIMNAGLSDLNFSAISIIGPGAAHFAFAPAPSTAPLPSLQNRMVQVVFNPLDPGLKTASLRVASDDPDEPTIDVPLSGMAFAFSQVPGWDRYK